MFYVGLKKNYLLNRRYKILINYVLGPILFLILSYSIYHRIQNQQDLTASWQLILSSVKANKSLIVLLFGLMLLNWSIESVKWQILTKPVQKLSFFAAFRSVFSGVSFSLFIPTGDYVGKSLYMKEGNRLKSVPLNFAGSISQLIITLGAGLIGLMYMRSHVLQPKMQLVGLSAFWLDALMYVIGSGLIVLVSIYYKIARITTLLEKIPFIYRYRVFIQNLETFNERQLTKILILSACRFVVFIVQYLLVFHIFNVEINWIDAISATCALFLVLALIPTITIAELGVRGEASIQLFGLLSSNTVGIAATAASIWVVNLIIPALAGSIFVIGIKIFRNN